MESGGSLLIELKITDFAEELGSEKPAPGGGSASALAGALASCLVKMVAHLSGTGHEEHVAGARLLREKLLHLVNRDTEAFNQVMASFKLPKGSDEEKQKRRKALQLATRFATEVPLEIMEVSLKVLELAREMAFHGNKNCLSDAGVAALLAAAACRGGAYNVLINLPGLKDEEFVADTRLRLKEILVEVELFEQQISDHVEHSLGLADLRISRVEA